MFSNFPYAALSWLNHDFYATQRCYQPLRYRKRRQALKWMRMDVAPPIQTGESTAKLNTPHKNLIFKRYIFYIQSSTSKVHLPISLQNEILTLFFGYFFIYFHTSDTFLCLSFINFNIMFIRCKHIKVVLYITNLSIFSYCTNSTYLVQFLLFNFIYNSFMPAIEKYK